MNFPPMRALEFITGHVIYKPAYTYKFQLKITEDGVDEMKEDLNASKIMYGFLRLQDPKTSLPKYVFFHWQGESVPGSRKGKAATHLR